MLSPSNHLIFVLVTYLRSYIKIVQKNEMKEFLKCILSIVCVRLVVLLLIRTSYVPDEYYQFQEPALYSAYGMESAL